MAKKKPIHHLGPRGQALCGAKTDKRVTADPGKVTCKKCRAILKEQR